MSPFAAFLDRLLREGRAILRVQADPRADHDADAVELLKLAHADYRLRVAGPPIDFDAEAAIAAAVLVGNACWFLVSRDEQEAELERVLKLPGPPRSPAAHLSADLTLRFLAAIHRRAKAHNPTDRLTVLLAEVARHWPLSGVLADIDEGPSAPPDFQHAGLWILYAERLARHEKPAWVPRSTGQEFIELVYGELGKTPPAAPAMDGHGDASDD